MPSKKKSKDKSDDWFDELDAELQEKAEKTFKDQGERTDRLIELNKKFINDFWRIWIKFEDLNVHFSMQPDYSSFADFEEFPKEWAFKDEFDFASVRTLKLMDKTQEENRTGDTLVFDYYTEDNELYLGVFFEFCEGETYYKYSGWKRIFARYEILDFEFPISEDDVDEIHSEMKDLVRVWYESHLKRDRDMIIDHVKSNYEKIEEYPE